MKLYLDMEFTGLHQKTTPVSLAIVADNNAIFYGEFTDYDRAQIDQWLHDNVLENLVYAKLPHTGAERPFSKTGYYAANNAIDKEPNHFDIYTSGSTKEVYEDLLMWLKQFKEELVFVTDVGHWDWVLFNQILGGSTSCVREVVNINYIPIEFSTLLIARGVNPDISRVDYIGSYIDVLRAWQQDLPFVFKDKQNHNALHDALILKACIHKYTYSFLTFKS